MHVHTGPVEFELKSPLHCNGLEGLSSHELSSVVAMPEPLSAQHQAEAECNRWSAEWCVGQARTEPAWGSFEVDQAPPALVLEEFRGACRSFPVGTGLGWDAMHPRALLRLPEKLLEAFVTLITWCERLGRWPQFSQLVVVVLLPKPDGGFRPIGLLPMLARIWSRARRGVALKWERMQDRPYLFAGPARGATVAAWKQAARAEHAASVRVDYAQTLLDLVKAFERIPHHVLVREVAALGFPMWFIRLAVATYRLPRVVRVGEAMSRVVVAVRGIVAGSGSATTEMRVVLIRIIDAALLVHPGVTPTLFVDDLGVEVAGGPKYCESQLVGFVLMVCDAITADGMEVSADKSVCLASTLALGEAVRDGLKQYNVKLVQRAKSLGAGLGAGIRRNTAVMKARMKKFAARLPRFRMLRRAGVNTARVIRTGGLAALCYGPETMGVSNSMLLSQRRLVAPAAAPGAGTCGQDIDLAFVLGDGGPLGKADPAYPAHSIPICHWAMAVWEVWLPLKMLQSMVASAMIKLTGAASPWGRVTGPAAAVVASAARLGWFFIDATLVKTDQGRELNFVVDSPAAIQIEVEAAVRRWRWRNVERRYPSLESGGRGDGIHMRPFWKLLKSTHNSPSWNATHRGALASVFANRQWCQSRCFKAGFTPHHKCLFCAADFGLDSAPSGTLRHRHFSCPRHQHMRSVLAPQYMLEAIASGTAVGLELDRGLMRSPVHVVPPPSQVDTFTWDVEPPDGTVDGVCYSDGSLLDGPTELLGRCGWSFVVLNRHRRIAAAAYGLCPPWVTTIPGAEAWALFQAGSRAEPGTKYRVDCKSVVDLLHAGPLVATASSRPLARLFRLLFTVFDDISVHEIVWMPAHTSEADVGRLSLGDGSKLSAHDRDANGCADELAKAAVEAHRVPLEVRKTISACEQKQTQLAIWIANATLLANNAEVQPTRDTAASRKVNPTIRALRNSATSKAVRRPRTLRPAALGGHTLVHDFVRNPSSVRNRRLQSVPVRVWRCMVCRSSSKRWNSICHGVCSGSIVTKWAVKVQQLANAGRHIGCGHKLYLSGEVIWCGVCGAYAEMHAIVLQKPCAGPPIRRRGGGHRAQLAMLRAGRHPSTRLALPPPRAIGHNSVDVFALVAEYRASPVGIAHASALPLNPRMLALLERVRKRQSESDAAEVRVVRRRICGKTTPGCRRETRNLLLQVGVLPAGDCAAISA